MEEEKEFSEEECEAIDNRKETDHMSFEYLADQINKDFDDLQDQFDNSIDEMEKQFRDQFEDY